jgi:hypothetical protein
LRLDPLPVDAHEKRPAYTLLIPLDGIRAEADVSSGYDGGHLALAILREQECAKTSETCDRPDDTEHEASDRHTGLLNRLDAGRFVLVVLSRYNDRPSHLRERYVTQSTAA